MPITQTGDWFLVGGNPWLVDNRWPATGSFTTPDLWYQLGAWNMTVTNSTGSPTGYRRSTVDDRDVDYFTIDDSAYQSVQNHYLPPTYGNPETYRTAYSRAIAPPLDSIADERLRQSRERRLQELEAVHRREEELRGREDLANQRALDLFLSVLTEAERAEFRGNNEHSVTITGRSGRIYQINCSHVVGNVSLMHQGQAAVVYCAHPTGVPLFDQLAAQVLTLRFHDHDFINVANVHLCIDSHVVAETRRWAAQQLQDELRANQETEVLHPEQAVPLVQAVIHATQEGLDCGGNNEQLGYNALADETILQTFDEEPLAGDPEFLEDDGSLTVRLTPEEFNRLARAGIVEFDGNVAVLTADGERSVRDYASEVLSGQIATARINPERLRLAQILVNNPVLLEQLADQIEAAAPADNDPPILDLGGGEENIIELSHEERDRLLNAGLAEYANSMAEDMGVLSLTEQGERASARVVNLNDPGWIAQVTAAVEEIATEQVA